MLDNVNNGILVVFGTEGTLIRGNRFARNGDDIVIDDASGNTIAHNLATDALGCPFCDPPTGFGIAVVGPASDNVVAANLVARTRRTASGSSTSTRRTLATPCPAGRWCARERRQRRGRGRSGRRRHS